MELFDLQGVPVEREHEDGDVAIEPGSPEALVRIGRRLRQERARAARLPIWIMLIDIHCLRNGY